ncbi:MAG: right-handed parallel beta-helix repeat-containing protein [Sphingobacteriales bacterium JAD_PAG50586_3]|nr:MAG: right-handed parallel beta-helix repeat-containing protein [Sphingobacteriales bacterium JAD_PAG50586_3]
MSVKRAFAVATLAIIVFAGIFSSCKKEIDNPEGGVLVFSTDTVQFDTVFTTMGSTTKAFKVYNPGDKKIKIDDIRLAGGTASQFRLNIDGTPGTQVTDVELEAGDSIFIFVEVTVDPQSLNTPFVIADSVMFTSGTSVQSVMLVAWGQDAYFYSPTTFSDEGLPAFSVLECTGGGVTWTNDKPHVIFGSLLVGAGCTLTIEAGCEVRFYKNSNLVIDEGATLIVNGLPDQKVLFAGTRLEDYLEDAPGQWGTYIQIIDNGQVFRSTIGGIWLYNNSNATINHAIIKNAYRGVQANPGSTLTLTNTEIYNNNDIGLLGVGATIDGYNNVVANAGGYSVALANGGNYNFRHCTFANYWGGGVRQTPTLLLNNYTDEGATTFPLTARFRNSIIYGNIDNEIGFDLVQSPLPTLLFEKSLIKIDPDFDTNIPSVFTNIIKNPFPALDFKSTFDNDYRLDTLTVAQDAGDINITNAAPLISTDNTGTVNRVIGDDPDMGAFEREY